LEDTEIIENDAFQFSLGAPYEAPVCLLFQG